MDDDKNFEMILKMLFGIEGGYSDNPNDKGGKTNLGVTQDTFDAWRKKNNMPKGSVKMDLTKDEAKDIYYNMYWKESGADKLKDPRDAMVLFDTAVNSGPETAKKMFQKSNENFYNMLDKRKEHYDNIISKDASQLEFKDGWYNRLKTLENNANKMIKDGFYKPDYYDEITPFDKGYKGNLNPVGEIPDRDAKRNKYQYNRNKAVEAGIIKSENVEDNGIREPNHSKLSMASRNPFKRKISDLAPWEIDDLLERYI